MLLLQLLSAWAETLAHAPVPRARATAEQNQISVSCHLDPTNFCRPTRDGDCFGCVCHVDHPQVFLELPQFGNAVSALKSLKQTALALPGNSSMGRLVSFLPKESTFWLQRSWQARVQDKDLLC